MNKTKHVYTQALNLFQNTNRFIQFSIILVLLFALVLNLLKDILERFVPSSITLRRGPRVEKIGTSGKNWFRTSADEIKQENNNFYIQNYRFERDLLFITVIIIPIICLHNNIYSADKKTGGRPPMPLPRRTSSKNIMHLPLHHTSYELNNTIFVQAEDIASPITVTYNTAEIICENKRSRYGNIINWSVCKGLENCIVEKEYNQNSKITFTCNNSQEKEHILFAQDHDTFIVSAKINDQIIITKEKHGVVATFTLNAPTKDVKPQIPLKIGTIIREPGSSPILKFTSEDTRK